VADNPYVIDAAEDFAPDDLFLQGRDQVILAVRIAPVMGHFDLSLLAAVIDEANARGMGVVREQVLHDSHLLIILEAYDEE
jgi:hypothetical protein